MKFPKDIFKNLTMFTSWIIAFFCPLRLHKWHSLFVHLLLVPSSCFWVFFVNFSSYQVLNLLIRYLKYSVLQNLYSSVVMQTSIYLKKNKKQKDSFSIDLQWHICYASNYRTYIGLFRGSFFSLSDIYLSLPVTKQKYYSFCFVVNLCIW